MLLACPEEIFNAESDVNEGPVRDSRLPATFIMFMCRHSPPSSWVLVSWLLTTCGQILLH